MKKGIWIDPEVTSIKTAEGTMTLRGLFIPLFIEQLLMNLMGTVNTLVLGHYSDAAVAAVGAANQVMGLIYTFYAVVSGGASIVISHRLGAGDEQEAGDAAFSALICGAAISAVFSLIFALAAVPVMSLMNLEPDVLEMAVGYFRICVSFSVMQGIMTASTSILRSYGKPKLAVAVSLLMNVINAVLNVLIVFQPVEIALKGTQGIAVANVISRGIALTLILFFLLHGTIPVQWRKKGLHSLRCVKSILHVGLPGGISSLSYSLSQVVSTSILAALGTMALSAKIYISSIVFYVYVIGYSLGLTTAILMGWMVGAKEYDKAYRLNQQVLRTAVLLNLVLSFLFFLAERPLVGLFTKNEEILTMAKGILFIDMFVEIGRAFNHVEDNSLRGAGDVVFPMVISVISCWLNSILFSWLLGVKLGWGLYGCWIAFIMDELFRGLIFWFRFRSRKWMNKTV